MVALKERISNEMKAALLGGNRFVGETLRNLKASILDEEVATNKRQDGLSDSEIEVVVAREIKKRTESAKIYRENDRIDLAEIEENEIEVLEQYMPEQLSEADLIDIINQKISELNATSMADMGKVIGAVKSTAGNSANGAIVARLVKEALN